MIKTACDLAGQFNVGNLVLAHRDKTGPVHQDVGTLQYRVSEETKGSQVTVLELFLLILVAWHAFEPAQWCNHRQQGKQLGMFGDARLHEQCRIARIDARRKPVDDHVARAFGNYRRIFVIGGQRVPVGDEEKHS